jgi:hypothetical protein
MASIVVTVAALIGNESTVWVSTTRFWALGRINGELRVLLVAGDLETLPDGVFPHNQCLCHTHQMRKHIFPM